MLRGYPRRQLRVPVQPRLRAAMPRRLLVRHTSLVSPFLAVLILFLPPSLRCGKASVQAMPCPKGTYCAAGSPAPMECPAGTMGLSAQLEALEDCQQCIAGTACPKGSSREQECPAGRYASANRSAECTECPSGWYQDTKGATSCKQCPAGELQACCQLLCALRPAPSHEKLTII